VSSSGRNAGTKPVNPVKRPDRPARARSHTTPALVLFNPATPLRSVSDVDPFMRTKRPYN
jgi:hypothetical protein